jgi:chromosomal replication initiation ATPase DnaA
MKYKNFLLNTTQRNRENIQRLKTLIEKQTGKDITINTRHRELVFARKIYYKILTLTTKMSYKSIGGTLGQHYATVIHSLNNFDWDYKKGTVATVETLTYENRVLEEKIAELKGQIEELGNELKETRSNNIRPRNQQATIYNASETVII